MARFAHILVELPCPRCGFQLAPGGAIGFQWGYCSNPHSGAYWTYEVGEPLLWRLDKSGNVPAWVYFRGGSANIGDPSFPDLVIRESEYDIRACLACTNKSRELRCTSFEASSRRSGSTRRSAACGSVT